jgi:hypothetical protein
MVAAEEGAVLFKSVSDDATAAMIAFRGKGMDRTLKTIKDVLLAAHDDCERLVVVVSAIFRRSASRPPIQIQFPGSNVVPIEESERFGGAGMRAPVASSGRATLPKTAEIRRSTVGI